MAMADLIELYSPPCVKTLLRREGCSGLRAGASFDLVEDSHTGESWDLLKAPTGEIVGGDSTPKTRGWLSASRRAHSFQSSAGVPAHKRRATRPGEQAGGGPCSALLRVGGAHVAGSERPLLHARAPRRSVVVEFSGSVEAMGHGRRCHCNHGHVRVRHVGQGRLWP